MNIRKVTQEDEPVLKEWLNHPEDCMLVTGRQTYSPDMFHSWYEAHDQFGYIFEDDSKAVAYGEIWVDAEEEDLELAHLVVAPSLRNKGIGKRLIQELLELCKDYPYEWVYMRIKPGNLQAIQCYKGAEFVEDPSLRLSFNSRWVWMRKKNRVSF
ncbi:GNAT family N-acetyltransferase [Rossellomorea sp. YZS02]|uniref:GNAT family N-acetyltransferase n=1 Tax=Rossellomorea sp. YZS02 TaxID=3097358 RepID=UPI002A1738E6|nr:GNAT family N-acetyltransferase [Rossellomorea sp. YZS02]MDX8344930.1 GNAT family N-acetyltransferase [Rossellomorea sp. YZS02]